MRYTLLITILLLSISSFAKNNKWEIACQAYTFKEFTLSETLEERIFEVHTKDVNKTDKTGHVVVIGEGIINWDEVFTELKRQNFKGKFVIEHETSWDNPVSDMKRNVTFLNSKID